MAHGLGTHDGGIGSALVERAAPHVAVEKAGCPGIPGAVCVHNLIDMNGVHPVDLIAAGDPRAVLAHLDCRNDVMACELKGQSPVVGTPVGKKRFNFILVGEHDIDPVAELVEHPIAGCVDDLK